MNERGKSFNVEKFAQQIVEESKHIPVDALEKAPGELETMPDEKRKILSNETYEGISDLNAKENTLKIKLSLLEKNNRYNTEQRTVYDNDVCELPQPFDNS